MNWYQRHQEWIDRHQNWAVLLWIILAPAMCFAIYFILALIFSYTSPYLIMPLATAMIVTSVISVVVVLIYFYIKSKRKKLSISYRQTLLEANAEKEKYEISATESQEEEYKHSVWEIYRKEWETANPEKRTELNKRMLRWQELIKTGQTASQAYIRVMEEESDETLHQPIPAEKKAKTKTRRYLLLVLAFVILLSISLVVYARISAPASEPSLEPTQLPESSSAAPIQTVTGDLVIEVNENGLSINNNRFDMDSTLDDYIKVLGNPSRVTELMNTIHTYDDAGIMLYHPPHSNEIISVSIDYTRGDYEFSPKHVFSGNLVIGGSIVQSTSSLDFLKSINTLTLEDSSFGVYRGHLGDTTLIFEYLESTDKLDGLAISFSKPTTLAETTPTFEQTGQELEKGWVRITIADVGSIDYPSNFLELQSGEYRDTATEFFQDLEIEQADFTLQQVGLNELKPSALNEYRRVLFVTDYLNPGEEVFRANEKYTLSQEELIEFRDELIDQLRQGFAETKTIDIKIIDPGSLEIMEVNGMFPMVQTYKRQLNDNPVVLVKTYMFQNYDKIHYLSFSCRVIDEEECRDIYEKVLYSFRLD